MHDCGYILRDPVGKALRVVGGLRDLTMQKIIESEYLRAQRLASVGTLAGGIAHDLNNVLAPVMLAVDLLRHQDAVAGPSSMLDVIENSTKRGAGLLRQVLSFTRGFDGETMNMCLGPMVEELGDIIRHTFPRNILIELKVSGVLWPVSGHPAQIHQILLNLAVNARDAMPGGGKLTLGAANLLIGAQGVPLNENACAGPYVKISVTDTGLGMAPEVIGRVFDGFCITKKDGVVAGAALATVDAIVKRHGGFQTVVSKIDCGSTFEVYLPALPQSTTHQTLNAGESAFPYGHGELILVVDDERSIREIAQHVLEAYRYRVLSAGGGEQAIEYFARHGSEVALMLTDLSMPMLDGADTILAVRQVNPRLPVIASSGVNSGELYDRAQAAGIQHFLMKPYSAKTLLEALHTVLVRRQSYGEPSGLGPVHPPVCMGPLAPGGS